MADPKTRALIKAGGGSAAPTRITGWGLRALTRRLQDIADNRAALTQSLNAQTNAIEAYIRLNREGARLTYLDEICLDAAVQQLHDLDMQSYQRARERHAARARAALDITTDDHTLITREFDRAESLRLRIEAELGSRDAEDVLELTNELAKERRDQRREQLRQKYGLNQAATGADPLSMALTAERDRLQRMRDQLAANGGDVVAIDDRIAHIDAILGAAP